MPAQVNGGGPPAGLAELPPALVVHVLHSVRIDVVTIGAERVLVATNQMGEQWRIPMGAEYAEGVGQKLIAPSVVLP